MNKRKNKKMAYIAPKIITQMIELEQGIAAGSANINTGSSDQTPQEREMEAGWSNSKDFDI